MGLGIVARAACFTLGLIAASGAQATSDADRHVMQYCAGVFDARAKWLDVMRPGDTQSVTMSAHRDQLLAASDYSVTDRTAPLRYGATETRFDEYSLALLTRFAERGEVSSCSQDALCVACTELLPTGSKLHD
ncbi:hypothetical protein TRP8649_01947 [Pelagimonas phthalicica]|uniref:Uncharacterized protein n=1 Tax=Pelagimonas phthalicica TaxID=1037362 RepID=A0A238JCF6_9RHOB|nr:hypothetical protein [Pelagimonas phthalicica]TDS93640.1 hypothetical protein CLV87_0125 [Pelagimonas phthalicica]SMX27837.1 hypothetical protein TRP8649_01947 [Pelagimonas phthalicica]